MAKYCKKLLNLRKNYYICKRLNRLKIMKSRKFFGMFFGMLVVLMSLVSVTARGNENYANQDSGDTNASELIYGEWWLVGWSDKGTWVNVDKKYVGHHSLSIEIPKEGYVMAYSMANEIFVGLLTLNGNEMVFGDGGGSTKVYCSLEENLFFEDHICDIKSYQLEKNQLKLYYTDDDYFLFTSDFGTRGTTSGMKSTSEAKTPAANTLYDLQGQRLIGPPTKGLYIQNGQKVIVR